MPVFNDRTAVRFLVERLDSSSVSSVDGMIVFIDDGSLEPMPEEFSGASSAEYRTDSVSGFENEPGTNARYA